MITSKTKQQQQNSSKLSAFTAKIKRKTSRQTKSRKKRLKTKIMGKTATQFNYCCTNCLNLIEHYNKLKQSYDQTLLEENKKLTSQSIEMEGEIEQKKPIAAIKS